MKNYIFCGELQGLGKTGSGGQLTLRPLSLKFGAEVRNCMITILLCSTAMQNFTAFTTPLIRRL